MAPQVHWMPIVQDGLKKEFEYVTREGERIHLGQQFDSGDAFLQEIAHNLIFVPEVLVAARAMKAGMKHLEPILSASGIEPLGTVIMGTVKGDLHDIGKNLCIMMLRGAGFTVHDLGVDTKPDAFMDAVVEHNAHVLGMSALLTTTMPNMGKTIISFEEAGLRDAVKIMVGGAPVTQEFADDMGADGYGKDAVECVELAKRLLGIAS